MVTLLLDEPLAVFGGEAVLHEGRVVAQTTSANFGYTVGKPVALAYLPPDLARTGQRLSLQSFGQTAAATVVTGAAYDPDRRRVLC